MPKSRAAGGRPETSRPPSSIVPSSCGSRPAIARSSVVLPQPEGPRKQTNSPRDVQRDRVQRGKGAKALGEIGDADVRCRRCLRRRLAAGLDLILHATSSVALLASAEQAQCENDPAPSFEHSLGHRSESNAVGSLVTLTLPLDQGGQAPNERTFGTWHNS